MKKSKVLAALVATMAVGATCAFAANPFADVPSDSWAYKSVVTLANSGIIQGVDGTHFQGKRNITRYEAAEITAKAMAHADRANAQQRAIINKLANEFAGELNTLGVRVTNLEQQVGTVKFSGDARVRYRHAGSATNETIKWAQDGDKLKGTTTTSETADNAYKNDKAWDYNMHLNADAKVSDTMTAHFSVFTDDQQFSDDKGAGDLHAFVNNANLEYTPNDNSSVQIGRIDGYTMGNAYGYQYGDVLEGVKANYHNDQFAVTAGYGKLKSGDHAGENVKTGFGEVEGFFGNGSAAGVYYNNFTFPSTLGEGKDAHSTTFNADSLWGAYVNAKLADNLSAMANYESVNLTTAAKAAAKKDGNKETPAVWVGQVTYGNLDQEKAGSWDTWVEYLHADAGSLVGGSSASWRKDLDNVKSWGIGVDYTVSKNVVLKAAQTFGSKMVKPQFEGKKEAGQEQKAQTKPSEYTTVSLNFSF